MAVYINLGNFSDRPVNVASACVAGATVEFNAVLAVDTSRYNNRKRVALLFGNGKTPETSSVLFSITANNARYNSGKESCTFDSDPDDFINFQGGTSQQLLDYLTERFGKFTDAKKAFKVTFGSVGHFLNADGEIIKSILSIEKIEKID